MIKTAIFKGSFTRMDQLPESSMPEYAFTGRSNVGKSSLINALCNRKDLAKVSGTPGKTQHLNYFNIDDSWFLVDLPGYGYARRSKKERRNWDHTMRTYLKNRPQLAAAFVLIDINVPPQQNDLDFLAWLGKNGIPFALVFTKIDKLKVNKLNQQINLYRKKLEEEWEDLPVMFLSSAIKREGMEELETYIVSINEEILRENQ